MIPGAQDTEYAVGFTYACKMTNVNDIFPADSLFLCGEARIIVR